MSIDLWELIDNHNSKNWLLGYNCQDLREQCQILRQQIRQQATNNRILRVIIAESESLPFIATLIAALTNNCHLFLTNPNWSESEWQQVLELVQPDLVFGRYFNPNLISNQELDHADLDLEISPLIMIPTGGSSGKIRFAIHTLNTLTASVKGITNYFNTKTINSCCVLPLYHVSGLMQLLRSLITGGQLLIISHKQLIDKLDIEINYQDFFLSLVPTQLQFLLEHNSPIISQFKTVFLGGAPPWESLLETARQQNIKLALTYGMTETASQIVTLKPQDFLKGNNSSGHILPHAQITIVDATGEIVKPNQIGIITIQADSLYLGYYPNLIISNSLITDDLGFEDEAGYLHIVGRNSHKIITGGYNVFPREVETAILATNLVADVAVIGINDSYWGQAITAFYVPKYPDIALAEIKQLLINKISNYKQPKHWLQLEQLPRNAQGKINYQQLKDLALSCLCI